MDRSDHRGAMARIHQQIACFGFIAENYYVGTGRSQLNGVFKEMF